MEQQLITTAEEFFNQPLAKGKLRVEIESTYTHLKGEKDKPLVLKEVDSRNQPISKLEHDKIENVEFQGFYFENTSFSHCTFRKVKFRDCLFFCSGFIYSGFDTVEFINCRFKGTLFSYDRLSDSNFTHCIFSRSPSRFFYCQIVADFRTITLFINCDIRTTMYLEDCNLDARLAQLAEIHLTNHPEDLKFIDACRLGNGDHNQIIYLTIGPIGSRNDFVTYIPAINWVKCGCWKEDGSNIYIGGSLEAFKEKVLHVYPEEGTYHHDDYMAAIKIFETARKKFLKKKFLEQVEEV